MPYTLLDLKGYRIVNSGEKPIVLKFGLRPDAVSAAKIIASLYGVSATVERTDYDPEDFDEYSTLGFEEENWCGTFWVVTWNVPSNLAAAISERFDAYLKQKKPDTDDARLSIVTSISQREVEELRREHDKLAQRERQQAQRERLRIKEERLTREEIERRREYIRHAVTASDGVSTPRYEYDESAREILDEAFQDQEDFSRSEEDGWYYDD